MPYTQKTSLTNLQIRESFLKLLDEKTLSKVTINDIVRQAMINRSTFYRHFDDKYDLLYQLEDQLLEQLQQLRLQTNLFSMDQLNVEQIVKSCQNERPILSRLFNDHGEGHFERRCKEAANQAFAQNYGEKYASDPEVQLIREGATASALQILKYWLTTENTLTINQVAHTLIVMQQTGPLNTLYLLHNSK